VPPPQRYEGHCQQPSYSKDCFEARVVVVVVDLLVVVGSDAGVELVVVVVDLASCREPR